MNAGFFAILRGIHYKKSNIRYTIGFIKIVRLTVQNFDNDQRTYKASIHISYQLNFPIDM